ncbi:glycosyltransferase family 2 protein [Roseobacter litoralis]|uniref:glycosyltransferase family 2 protein n=1 Tax=Roseobacter litoralis TaxID=42443 RepID=UPI00248FB882|nr:glycosyltransferase family A protein [Roseobacter litoralis]
MDKKASVIIPTYHSWQDLQLCLDLLAAQTTPASDFEIIVANNAVSDDVPDDFRLPPNARVIQEPKPGSYAARNAGIRAAGTDLLFFTDADCRPRPDYIAHGLKAFEAHPNVMRFAGAVELEAAGQVWTVAERVDRMMSLKQEHYATQGRAATANVFARRAAFEMVGLFDDTALSGGDMEWARRCMAQGVEQLYVPEVIVGHPARASMEAHVIKRRRILGAQIRNADPKKRWKYYIPRFKRFLLPSFGAMRIAFREPDISVSERFQMWLFLNKLRRVSAKEQMRLTWFKGKYERR